MDTARPAQRLDGPHETEAPCSSAYDFKRVSILRGLPLSGCGSDGQCRFAAFHVALSCRRSWDGPDLGQQREGLRTQRVHGGDRGRPGDARHGG